MIYESDTTHDALSFKCISNGARHTAVEERCIVMMLTLW
jgi:hypothetical protein